MDYSQPLSHVVFDVKSPEVPNAAHCVAAIRRQTGWSLHRCKVFYFEDPATWKTRLTDEVQTPDNQNKSKETMAHIRFNSIDLFPKLLEEVRSAAEFHKAPLPVVMFRGTVKVNGTNRAVVFSGPRLENVQYQTRDTIIIPGDKSSDHHGFAAWLESDPAALQSLRILALKVRDGSRHRNLPVQIYGEWAGPGICGRATNAVEHLPEPHFFVCAGRVSADHQTANYEWFDESYAFFFNHPRLHMTRDFGEYFVRVNFSDPSEDLKLVEEITSDVEKQCPIGKALLPGCPHTTGEGLVWAPQGVVIYGDTPQRPNFPYKLSDFVFKSKGEKHRKGPRTFKLNADQGRLDLIDTFVTHALDERLDQAILVMKDRGLEITMPNYTHFVKWLLEDIEREESLNLQTAGLEMDDLTKPIGKKAHSFYRQYLETQKV